MAAVFSSGELLIPQIPQHLDARLVRDQEFPVQPVLSLPGLSAEYQAYSSSISQIQTSVIQTKSSLEALPVEIINQILSHLVHPRSRLPGLTEAQSAHDFPRQTKLEIKNREDLTTLPDSQRWAVDIFDFNSLRHPFHVLSLTSKRLNEFVEGYCGHLVRACNMFNLPFAHYDKYGAACVHPDLSQIVYRRLWLQHAPRLCIYCHVGLDSYPFPMVKRLIAACEACFYRQTLVRHRCPDPLHAHPANGAHRLSTK